ncbi:MAG TPA: energy transducer TonB [Steroidobacteraceae bacterium]
MTFNRLGLLALSLVTAAAVYAQSPGGNSVAKVPSGVILVKGAWSSASDQTTPVPEGGQVTNVAYNNPYFQLSFPVPQDWVKKYDGPPPSDTGYYVLAQLEPRDMVKGSIRGSLMITAADLFFSPTKANTALQFVKFSRNNLQGDYKVARDPAPMTLAGRSFVRFDYFSPVAGLHWDVLATELRCHVVQFVFTSRDTKLLDHLVADLAKVKLTEDASAPVCVKGYASAENVVERVDPIFSERRFNSIPVRVIIDKEGKVKHIHFLSAFPEQAKTITEALQQWKFKPYLRDGQPVEVETGILFGHAPAEAPEQLQQTTTATR